MPYFIGIAVALVVGAFAHQVRLDRERAFYPTLLAASVSYYVLFAAISGSLRTISIESLIMTVFIAAAAIGFRKKLWLVVAAFIAHGVLDVVHGSVVTNSGMPAWWPAFCMSFDIAAAAILARLIILARTGRFSLPLAVRAGR